MINTDEKRAYEPRDREYIIFVLDGAYARGEGLSQHLHLFDEFEITRAQRNETILASEFNRDEDLVSALVLFG
ncbi:hypothetical protein [Xanthomonas phage BUDD]|nr:hypothetical protein [Xanthomonas phage BUDD]